MQAPQACKSATDSWNRLPVSHPHSHSFLMGLKDHKEYTNIVQHIDSNSENKRLDFVLIASTYFSPLGAWYKASCPLNTLPIEKLAKGQPKQVTQMKNRNACSKAFLQAQNLRPTSNIVALQIRHFKILYFFKK